MSFQVEGRVGDLLDRREEVIGPEQCLVDGCARRGLAFLRIDDGAAAGPDLGGGLLERQVATQPGGAQVGPQVSENLFDGIGRADGEGGLAAHGSG